MSKVAYRDLREWISELDKRGLLARVQEEVDWNCELGTILRRTWDVYGDASPALLFDNIVGYKPPAPSKVFAGAFRSWYAIAMMLGLNPDDTGSTEMVATLRERTNRREAHLPPCLVETGPVKDNILTGDEIDLLKFPIPHWNPRDGGRFITMPLVMTKDPEEGWVNVGTYRLMVLGRDECAIQINPAHQHIGGHYHKYIQRREPMEAAVVVGCEPALTYMSACATAVPLPEMDIAGAIRGEPLEVVPAETVDILVPAHAEIVLEGTIDPSERKVDGACGEVSGYYGNTPVPKPVFRVKTVTYRNDPIFHGSLEGHPVDEDHALASIALSAYVWDILEMAGVRGIREVAMPLCACGGFGHAVISIKPMMHGHADTIASVIWGSKMAAWCFKHIIVVDEDIDPWNTEQVNWSLAWRVRASEDVKVWKNHRGSPLDPRVPPEEKGFQDRMLIDATRPYHWSPRSIWGAQGVGEGEPLRFPPSTRPAGEMARLVNEKWETYGIKPARRYIGKPEGMMKKWWDPENIRRATELEEAP